ncbi:MAG: MerR family transcriptional regulator [Coriobacteriia bacterium]|nr:MerR family transcriptional regulator [Coriobacteriia bacterium]MCL2870381.1 MerR family transcriptional regulator [Coriobacteriia bacterium]
MDEQQIYTIGQLAKLGGITTKTLRHYDRIGLLRPSNRSNAGYRLYSSKDGRRFAEILAYRAIDMPLNQITQVLDGSDSSTSTPVSIPASTSAPASKPTEKHGRADRLVAHLQNLQGERKKLDGLIRHIEEMLLHEQEGAPMSTHDELNGFTNDPHHDEAKERWGNTDAWQESQRRIKGYTAQDWNRYKTEAADINDRFVALMQAGISVDSAEARALAEEHRQLISRWFYECPPEMHANFGAMWEADPRFKKNIDEAGAGLSEYMTAAFKAAAR